MSEYRCEKGFALWLQQCKDVNECDQDIDWCGNLKCENSVGSYSCYCPEGSEVYRVFNVESQFVETYCRDIDECLSGDTCPRNAHCQNKDSGYNCICDDGYHGDLCVDINECINEIANCTTLDQCINTEG